jgi:hypothetical protein
MLKNGAHPFPRPWLYFPPILLHIQHIWVHEDGEEGITIMITLNRYTLPSHPYYITNPPYSEVMEENYDFHHYQIPQVAPMQILDPFGHHNLRRVW